MGIATVVLLVFAALLFGYGVVLYNNLVALKHGVSQAWSNIGVLLKQRNAELPKLVETCRQYMAYESATFERIVRARDSAASAQARGDVGGLGQAESQVRLGLKQLFALAEDYPQLAANESFRQLQARITALEESISDRRELYNAAVNHNNVRIEQFPDAVLARSFGFGPATLLQFSDAETADVDIKSLFAS